MFSTYQQKGYRNLIVMILCRIPSLHMLQQIRDSLSISSCQEDISDKPFQGSFLFPKDFVYMCLSTHNVVTEKGWMWKGPEERLCKYIAQRAASIQLTALKSSVCLMWPHRLSGYFLPTAKTLKESQSYVWAYSGGRTGLSKEEREATVWNTLSVDPDFTEHLRAAH